MNEANSILGEDLQGGAGAAGNVVATSFTKFEHATVGILYIAFCLMGVSSNLLTAVAFYKDPGLVKSTKAWLHICLALANVIVVAPAALPASSSFSGKWLYGDTLCQAYAFEGMFSGMLAIGAVIMLSIERYAVGTGKPQDSGWFYTWSILAIIGNAIFWAVMPLLGWSRYTVELSGTSCAIDLLHPDQTYISYIINLEIFSFVLPMSLAVLCLYWVKGQGQTAPEGEGRPTSAPVASTSSHGQSVPQDAEAGFSEEQLRSLCYTFIVFVIVGWGPFAFLCTSTIVSGAQGLSMLAGAIPPLACKLMVSAYPLAYAVTSARFRRSFLAVFGATEVKKD